MLVEIGHFAMILALALSATQAFFGLTGAALKRERWMSVATSAVTGQFLFMALGTATLVHAFVVNDFSVKYVANHSNSALPLFYRVAALWGAHEGSLLLWICVLGVWSIAVAWRGAKLPADYLARVLGVLGVRRGTGDPRTRSEHQNKVLKGLGLRGPNCVVVVDNTPSFRGMIKKILHLVTVEESDA